MKNMKTLIFLLIVGITKITLINYLGTIIVTESGSHLSKVLMYQCGYTLISKKLPPPPWTLSSYKPAVIDSANSDYWSISK